MSDSVLCIDCNATVLASLASLRLVSIDGKDTPLVVELSQLGESVQQCRPHPGGKQIRYKKGKLTCVCGNNLGNIQNNISVPPFRQHTEVGLLKFKGICFSLSISPGRVFTIPAARTLQVCGAENYLNLCHRKNMCVCEVLCVYICVCVIGCLSVCLCLFVCLCVRICVCICVYIKNGM